MSTFGRLIRFLALWLTPVGLVSGSIALVVLSNNRDDTAVRLLQAILSWPVVTLTIGFVFLSRFQSGIGGILSSLSTRAFTGRAGPVELRADGIPQAATDEGAVREADAANAPEDVGERLKEIEALRERLQGDETEREAMQEAIENSQRAVWFWYYEYLNVYLRPHTQSILRFLAVIPVGIHRSALDALVLQGNPIERRNVLTALESHGLVEFADSGNVEVTERGKTFLGHQETMGRTIIPNANPPGFGLPPMPGVPSA